MLCFLFFCVLITGSTHILPGPLELFHFGCVLCLGHCFVPANCQAFKIRRQEKGAKKKAGFPGRAEPLAEGVPKAELRGTTVVLVSSFE